MTKRTTPKKPASTRRKDVPPAEPHPLSLLPFVEDFHGKEREKRKKMDVVSPGRCFWAIHPSGHMGTDFLIGTLYANEAAAYMAKHNTSILSWIVEEIVKSGEINYVTIGFFERMGRLASSATRLAG